MIKRLFETHLNVTNLKRSIDFYGNTLGLKQCYSESDRRTAFFWIGEEKQAMLGLWENPKDQVYSQHFAFECDVDWILNESVNFLKSRGLKCRNFLKDGTERPMVFVWMPAVSIYFADPDNHSLEFIGMLPGKSRPEKGALVLGYEEWLVTKEEG